jgi:hypothetical protein
VLDNISARNTAAASVKGLQSIFNAISNRISAIAGGAGSVTSNEASAISAQAASAISQLNSVVSQLASVVTAYISTEQIRHRSNVVSLITGAANVNIAGLSLSMAASALYAVDGMLLWQGSLGVVGFGVSLPALGAAGSFIRMVVDSDPPNAVVLSAIAAGTQTDITTHNVGTGNVIRSLKIEGLVATSAAGTMQIVGRASANKTLSSRGGYLRGKRIY